jgi:hypothetical protein
LPIQPKLSLWRRVDDGHQKHANYFVLPPRESSRTSSCTLRFLRRSSLVFDALLAADMNFPPGAFLNGHLSRRWRDYRPSETLTVCHHIRFRFPQDSGLASSTLLTPDNNLPRDASIGNPHPATCGTHGSLVGPLRQVQGGELCLTGASYLTHSWRPIGTCRPMRYLAILDGCRKGR